MPTVESGCPWAQQIQSLQTLCWSLLSTPLGPAFSISILQISWPTDVSGSLGDLCWLPVKPSYFKALGALPWQLGTSMGGPTVMPSGIEGVAATDKDASIGSDSRLAFENPSPMWVVASKPSPALQGQNKRQGRGFQWQHEEFRLDMGNDALTLNHVTLWDRLPGKTICLRHG